jgi:hypothetical protein
MILVQNELQPQEEVDENSFQAILDRGTLRFSERDLLFETLQIGLGLKQLSPARSFGHVERTFGASHAMWALATKVITAVAVPKVVVLPRLSSSRDYQPHRVAGAGTKALCRVKADRMMLELVSSTHWR